MAIKKELVDELLKDEDPKKVFASEGLMAELTKALAEGIMKHAIFFSLRICWVRKILMIAASEIPKRNGRVSVGCAGRP